MKVPKRAGAYKVNSEYLILFKWFLQTPSGLINHIN